VSAVEVRGVRLSVRVDGPEDAPEVVLSNSIACDLSMWEPQVPRLADRFRIVRYDLRGHGGSAVASEPYGLDDLGADLLGVLNALGIERAHSVGVSLGGMVSLWLAARHPERVDRLALISTAARIGTPEGWRRRVELVRAEGMPALVDLQLGRFFSGRFRTRHPDAIDRVAAGIRAMSADGYVGACLALAEADLREEVGAVTAPTLIVAGREDVSTPVTDAEWLRDHIPASRLVVLEGAAHLCSLERPDRVTEELLRFLGEDR
jgi:3-oxoadipate enol-lactonase